MEPRPGPRRRRLIGRDRESFQLSRALSPTSPTHLIVVTGAPGMGKTALVTGALAELDQHRVLEIAGDPHDVSGPLSELSVLAAELGVDEEFTAAGHELSARVGALFSGLDRRRGRPVIVVEDAHWLDEVSQQILAGLARVIHRLPATMLLILREGQGRVTETILRVAAASADSLVLELTPLSAGQVHDFLQQRLQASIPAPLAASTAERTGGSPLHLEAAIGLLRSGAVARLEDAVRNATDSLGAPGVLEDFLEAELSTADDATRAALLALAVGGPRSPAELTETLSALGHDRVVPSALRRSTLVETGRDGKLSCHHDLQAEAIVRQAEPAALESVHRGLARALPRREALTHRIALARSSPDPHLVQELSDSWIGAIMRGDRQEVHTVGAMLMTILPAVTDRYILQVIQDGQDHLVDQAVARALELHHDSLEPGLLGVLRALQQLAAGDLDDAAAHSRRLDVGTLSHYELLLLGYTVMRTSNERLVHGDFHLIADPGPVHAALRELAATPHDEPAVTLAAQLLTSALESVTLLAHDDSSSLQVPSLLASLGEVVDSMRGKPGTEIMVGPAIALRAEIMRQWGLANGAAVLLRKLRREDRSLTAAVACALTLSWIDVEAGRWDRAHSTVLATHGRLLGTRVDVTSAQVVAMAGLVPALRGEDDTVEDVIAAVGVLTPAEDRAAPRVVCDLVRVWQHTAAGIAQEQTFEALHRLWDHGASGRLTDVTALVLRLRAALTLGHTADVPAVRSLLRDGHVAPDCARGRYVSAHVDALAATASGASSAEIHALFDRARELLEEQMATEVHAPLRIFVPVLAEDHVRALAAAPNTRGAHLEQAVTTLLTAADLVLNWGARAWSNRLRSLDPRLTPTGAPAARPGMMSPALVDALAGLTSREKQIALLVRDGASNREIAEQLFLSIRTVEYHVANALTKLDCRNRVELRSTLASAPRDVSPTSTS